MDETTATNDKTTTGSVTIRVNRRSTNGEVYFTADPVTVQGSQGKGAKVTWVAGNGGTFRPVGISKYDYDDDRIKNVDIEKETVVAKFKGGLGKVQYILHVLDFTDDKGGLMYMVSGGESKDSVETGGRRRPWPPPVIIID